MTNYNNYYMEAIVNFGAQRQPQRLLVDTGSSWTWTMADNCSNDSKLAKCRETTEVFHPRESESFQALGEKKYIKYGKGEIEGDRVKDTVAMGPAESPDEIKADEFPFLLVYQSARNF